MEKVSFNYNGKKIKVNAKECSGICKGIGLMFSDKQKSSALLFLYNKPTKIKIHSFFVFFPFVAVWFDEDNKIISLKKVKPFTFSASSRKPHRKLLEIPVNKKYAKIVKLLVGD